MKQFVKHVIQVKVTMNSHFSLLSPNSLLIISSWVIPYRMKNARNPVADKTPMQLLIRPVLFVNVSLNIMLRDAQSLDVYLFMESV